MADESRTRVELVVEPGPNRMETGRTAIGLLLGLFLGRSSLMAAATGREQFEMAIGHFVLIVLVCVGGALLLGHVYDRTIVAARNMDDQTDETPAPEGIEPQLASDPGVIGQGLDAPELPARTA